MRFRHKIRASLVSPFSASTVVSVSMPPVGNDTSTGAGGGGTSGTQGTVASAIPPGLPSRGNSDQVCFAIFFALCKSDDNRSRIKIPINLGTRQQTYPILCRSSRSEEFRFVHRFPKMIKVRATPSKSFLTRTSIPIQGSMPSL